MKIEISNGMLTALIINVLYAKSVGITMGAAAREVGADMWFSTLLSSIQGLLMMVIGVWIIRRCPKLDLIDQTVRLLGKWPAKLVTLMIVLFFMSGFGIIMVSLIYHLKNYFLPDAPMLLVVIVPLIVSIYGCYMGLEVMGRMALIGVFSIFTLNILLIIGAMHDFDIGNLMPVFNYSFGSMAKASRFYSSDWTLATMMVLMILPQVSQERQWMRSSSTGIIIGTIAVLLWPILEAGVLSAPVTSQYAAPSMQLARSVHIGTYIQRYELIMMTFCTVSNFIQIMVGLFCASFAASKLFERKDYRIMLIPIGLLVGAWSYLLANNQYRAAVILEHWPLWAFIFAVSLPLIFYIAGFFARKRLAKQA